MKKAYIGIGTNIGDRLNNIENAVKSLGLLPGTQVTKVSSVYETEPWGYTDQDDFLNACVEVETNFSPKALLGACLGIEAAFGRERPFKNAPRIIDVDLLLYEGVTMDEYELILPHPRMHERSFVLIPLKDILETLQFNDINLKESYENCDKNGVKKYSDMNILKDLHIIYKL